jgi:hypothetical protein
MMENPLRSLLLGIVLGGCGLALASGCHKLSPSGEAAKSAPQTSAESSDEQSANSAPGTAAKADQPGDADSEDEGVHLKPEEVTKLGLSSEPAQPLRHAPEASGFAVVLAHDTVAQLLAELRTASAVARQSQAAFERGKRLAGTVGAMPVDSLEAAERQATVDEASLDLARQRLSSAFGQQAPWNGKDDSTLLRSLARGESKLARVTFPMSSLSDAVPTAIRLGRIGVGLTARTWDANTVWEAPADATVPGRSFFTIFKGDVFREGERLIAWTAVGKADDGVLIPSSAVVISGGKYWCYIEKKPGTYVRTEVDPDMPVNGGYFVSAGVDAGDKVVVLAAGQLLARELNPRTEAE